MYESIKKKHLLTVEYQFLYPPREAKIGSRNQDFEKLGGEFAIFMKQVQGNDFCFELSEVSRNQGFEIQIRTSLYFLAPGPTSLSCLICFRCHRYQKYKVQAADI